MSECDSFSVDIESTLMVLTRAGRLPPTDMWSGVGDAEIAHLESVNGAPLPAAYRQFLRQVGRTVGARAFGSSGVFWPAPLGFKQVAAETLEKEQLAMVGKNATFVMVHDGYIFFYCSDSSDDPPVMALPSLDGGLEPALAGKRFSSWLLDYGMGW
jgi:hypothetical protein